MLTQLTDECAGIQSSLDSLQSELGTELHSQLDPSDQRQVDLAVS